ncbi:MAG: alpha/beta hydrolase, partial [Deltaproteobacteria bacterium]|nr:alpha/beta hydrolase [Deltaproteobacteria bacterium]
MPMIVNEKMRIHYRVEGERGAFLLLHHGLFGSLRDWYETDWVKELSGEFRLILVDSRGHGRSDPVGSPGDFTLEGLARDVVAVLDELNIRNSHYLGYGLGAMVGFELIRNHPERLRITMLGGEVPYVTAESVETWNRWSRTLAQESLAGLVAKLKEERLFSGIAPSEREAGDACEEMILQGLCAHKP